MKEKFIKFFKKDKFAEYIGAKLIDVKPGYAKTEMKIEEHHLNGAGIIQGGVIFTLADFALAAASNSHGKLSLGINATISYFKPAKGKILIGEAREIAKTKRTGTYEVEIFDKEFNVLIAKLMGTVFRKDVEINFE